MKRTLTKFSRHFLHFIPLLVIFFIGIITFGTHSYDKSFQGVVAVVMGVSYVLWGIVHHLIHKDLDVMVVIEYVLVASLGLFIIFSLLFGA